MPIVHHDCANKQTQNKDQDESVSYFTCAENDVTHGSGILKTVAEGRRFCGGENGINEEIENKC